MISREFLSNENNNEFYGGAFFFIGRWFHFGSALWLADLIFEQINLNPSTSKQNGLKRHFHKNLKPLLFVGNLVIFCYLSFLSWRIRCAVPGPDIPGFLLQPFRKPKRIRTAFSPSQLLKLEHAFEKNHYVVGAERKQLAQSLSLTETQVNIYRITTETTF